MDDPIEQLERLASQNPMWHILLDKPFDDVHWRCSITRCFHVGDPIRLASDYGRTIKDAISKTLEKLPDVVSNE